VEDPRSVESLENKCVVSSSLIKNVAPNLQSQYMVECKLQVMTLTPLHNEEGS